MAAEEGQCPNNRTLAFLFGKLRMNRAFSAGFCNASISPWGFAPGSYESRRWRQHRFSAEYPEDDGHVRSCPSLHLRHLRIYKTRLICYGVADRRRLNTKCLSITDPLLTVSILRQRRCFVTSLGQRPRNIDHPGVSAESAIHPPVEGAIVGSEAFDPFRGFFLQPFEHVRLGRVRAFSAASVCA
jgi:hypothetical protein